MEEIKSAVLNATGSKQKAAMFHYQVLKHADELEGFNPTGFCKEISMPASYRTEFTKMLALSRLMKEQGAKINWN
ncbi:MAG: hypothetical protein WAL75_01960 [Terracidiphilus sp.]